MRVLTGDRGAPCNVVEITRRVVHGDDDEEWYEVRSSSNVYHIRTWEEINPVLIVEDDNDLVPWN